jgi:hypothetical protein
MRESGSDPGERAPRSSSPRRAPAAALCCFALGSALSGAIVRPRLPEGGEPGGRAEIKLAHLRSSTARYDTLFLGSSRTFRGLSPRVFDAVTAEAGAPTSSFNLGVPGTRATEVLRLLERLSRVRPDGWRTVFVDPEGFEVLLDESNYLSRPVIDWHDLETTRLVCDYIRETERGRSRRKLWMHGVSCAYHLAGVGRALPWVDGWLGIEADPERIAETLGPLGDGYVPQERGMRRGFRRELDEYAGRVADLEAAPLAAAAPQAVFLFREIERRIEALGARAVFMAQPGLYLNSDLVQAARAGAVDTLLRFDEPARFPDLYEPAARFDANHLNALGAERFTRHLAEAYLALERSGP